MSYQALSTATDAVRNSGGVFALLADRIGPLILLVMGLAMGGVTVLTGA